MEKLKLNEFTDSTVDEIKILINELLDKSKELEERIKLLEEKDV